MTRSEHSKTLVLKCGASLIDVYQDLCDRAYGDNPATRSLEDLRKAIASIPNVYDSSVQETSEWQERALRHDAHVHLSMDWVYGCAWSPNAFLGESVVQPLAFIDELTFTFGAHIDAYEWLLQGLARAECCMCVNKTKEIAFMGVRQVNGEPWIMGFDLDEMGDRVGELYAVAPLQKATLHLY